MPNTMHNMKMNSSSVAMPQKIVGLCWVENPRPWWVPPGLEETQGPGANPPAYKPLTAGAEREWKDDEEGFQPYLTRRQRQNRRRQNRKHQHDTYDFDDSY
jgi:hypothetical protein